MLGDAALTKAIAAYRPEQDTDAAYLQHLLEAQFTPRRNLEAFFDSWVYHDYGLPDLRVDAANARQTLENNYLVSVTVENLTRVWVETRVMVKDAGGEVRTERLQVPGNAKSTTRVSFQGTPANRRSQRWQRSGIGSLEQHRSRWRCRGNAEETCANACNSATLGS